MKPTAAQRRRAYKYAMGEVDRCPDIPWMCASLEDCLDCDDEEVLSYFPEFSLMEPDAKDRYNWLEWLPPDINGNNTRKIILEFCIQMTYK